MLTYTYKNGNKNTSEVELLSWNRITSILDIDSRVWSKYYFLQTDEVNAQLSELIAKAFKKQETIAKFEKIIQVEKRPSFDGVYYRILLQTVTGFKYQVIFFWIPETDFLEILKYELASNGYDASAEKRIQALPKNDKFFDAAQKFLNNNFGTILSSSTMEFIATYQTTQTRYIRFVFVSITGKYELILAIEVKNLAISVVRWEKVEDGYISIDISSINPDQFFKQAFNVASDYCTGKLSISAKPSFADLKVVPGYSRYYRLLYTAPFPFVLFIEGRESQTFTVRGIERIQITPTSEYYNDRLFAGYRALSLNELRFDIHYKLFFAVLEESQFANIINTETEIVAAFRLVSPLGFYYKIIYRVSVTK